MSVPFDWKKLTEQYFNMKIEYHKMYIRDGGKDPDCDDQAFLRWNCCQKHRRLMAMEQYLITVGFALSCGYGLQANSAVITTAALYGLIPPPPNQKLPAIGDRRWLLSLSIASGVGLPDELMEG